MSLKYSQALCMFKVRKNGPEWGKNSVNTVIGDF